MTNKQKNNQLWIQYTPGSAGRSFLICCTTSDAVGDWIDNPLPDPIKFATERFCVVDSSEHMNNEPITPYDIKWYTRNAIFDRGDNLTKAQAHDYLLECKLSKKHYNENKLIANVWQKPHIPTWAKDEKIITICADEDSIPWLLERRRQVFYEWFEKEVHLLRYKPSKAPIGPHSKFYKPMQYVHEYTDADTFMRWDIKKEHVTSGPGLNIKLSDLLRGNLESIWDQVDEYLLQPINRQWCNKLMNTWRQRWV
tara:strand:- start:52 stop:810 length:759 start_codon:yes stop_codon:yes gene_type:complete